jgi:hypothetical protein
VPQPTNARRDIEMPNKPRKPAQKKDVKKFGMNFPKTGEFDTPTMRRVVFDQPMTERDVKDFKTKAGRKKFYKDRMGASVFGAVERDIKDGYHKKRMSDFDKKSKAIKSNKAKK